MKTILSIVSFGLSLFMLGICVDMIPRTVSRLRDTEERLQKAEEELYLLKASERDHHWQTVEKVRALQKKVEVVEMQQFRTDCVLNSHLKQAMGKQNAEKKTQPRSEFGQEERDD